ncbi:hypothetical protein CMI48_00665 [Candidatus Pacearchaeota archaeon]|nr:hypothetical protein [Candidatus Pacearchaeota archaeon]MAE49317.1 hypothetical protein [Candidatus Pacearchaeota archaeon]
MKLDRILLSLLGVGLLLRFVLIFVTPLEHLVQIMSDDGFIAMQIMRNVVESGVVSFDGVVTTNGFQPLYYLILLPFFKLLSGVVAYETIALVMLSVFDVLTAWVLYSLVSMYYSDRTAKLTAAFWLFNPGTLFIMLMGVEASVSAFFLGVFALSYAKVKRGRHLTGAKLVGLGFLWGLLFWARTEFVLLGLPLLVDAWWHLRRKRGLRAGKSLGMLIAVGLAALLTVLPWLWFSWSLTGHVSQDSGRAIYALTHVVPWSLGLFVTKACVFLTKYALKVGNNLGSMALFGLMLGVLFRIVSPSREGRGSWLWLVGVALFLAALIPEPNLGLSADATQLALLVGLGVVSFVGTIGGLRGFSSEGELGKMLREQGYLLGFAVLHVLFYTTYLWLVQAWHIFSVLFIGVLFLVPPLFRTLLKQKRFLMIGFVFFVLLVKIFVLWSTPSMPWQVDMYHAGVWLGENTVEGTVVGAFDAGIVAYFSERETVNLDGVVNREAEVAFREGWTERYIAERGVSYLMGDKLVPDGFVEVQRFGDEIIFERR